MDATQDRPDLPSVLVVDDELDIRDGCERVLSRLGLKVLKASRGDAALDILEREQVSIVLLDLKMPGMSGMDLLPRIQQMDARIIVIVITGFATVETAIEAMKKGAYDFIPKPFEPEHLRIVVNRAWEKIRLTAEAERLESQRRLTLLDLDTEKSRIRTIVESLPNGVMVTNSAGQVVLTNPAFQRLMEIRETGRAGRPVEEYIPEERLCGLIRDISAGRYVDFEDLPDQEIALPGDKHVLARGRPILGEKRECLGAVVNFVDITAIKALDRLKSEFVAKVSHELRSPLSTIHEQLALVIKDLVGEAVAHDQQILARAKEKTQGLISLIGDLLDLSRIEEGLICHEPQPLSVEEILHKIVDFLGTKAESKKQSLRLVLPDEPLPELHADPLAVESIFGNLIANAIHYTQPGGDIAVTVDLAGIHIRTAVSDNGFGIAEQHIDRIFERFYRVKNEKTRYITGTGLGLSIVKGLVDSMGGFIDVESAPGEGSTFTVLLPISNPSQAL